MENIEWKNASPAFKTQPAAPPPLPAQPSPQLAPQETDQRHPQQPQAFLTMSQAQDISSKDLKCRWEMNELMRRGLDDLSARLQQMLQDLGKREAALATKEAEVEKK